jgi:hypothetical protein
MKWSSRKNAHKPPIGEIGELVMGKDRLKEINHSSYVLSTHCPKAIGNLAFAPWWTSCLPTGNSWQWSANKRRLSLFNHRRRMLQLNPDWHLRRATTIGGRRIPYKRNSKRRLPPRR